jgi:site-specific recombinase XerD
MKHRTSDPLFATVESFFSDYLQRIRGARPLTLVSYRESLRLFFEYVEKARGIRIDRLRLSDLDAELVVDFLEHLEHDRHNSVGTRNNRLAALHSFFAHALRRWPDHAGRLARIVALPSKRRVQPPPRYLEPPAVQALLHSLDCQTAKGRRDYALLLFLFNTGARVSEAIAVRFDDLLPGPTPAVRLHGKGGKILISPLWPATLVAIKAQRPSAALAGNEPVFVNARGTALSRNGAYYIVTHVAAAAHRADPVAPEKAWPHLFRHSCGVALLQAGVDLTVIRDQLGHASVATTGRYATSNLRLKKAALKAFWTTAGLSSPKSPPKRPTARLSEFLRSH